VGTITYTLQRVFSLLYGHFLHVLHNIMHDRFFSDVNIGVKMAFILDCELFGITISRKLRDVPVVKLA
jgi:hypothetical protein